MTVDKIFRSFGVPEDLLKILKINLENCDFQYLITRRSEKSLRVVELDVFHIDMKPLAAYIDNCPFVFWHERIWKLGKLERNRSNRSCNCWTRVICSWRNWRVSISRWCWTTFNSLSPCISEFKSCLPVKNRSVITFSHTIKLKKTYWDLEKVDNRSRWSDSVR